MRRRLLDGLGSRLRVVDVHDIGPSMRLLRLQGPDVSGWTWSPGQQVRVQVGHLPGPLDLLAGQLRTYSIWTVEADTVQLCVFDHGEDGPGALWARTAQPGDEVVTTSPRGDFVLRPSVVHLFVGEETAMPPIGAMMAAVPSREQAHVVLEIGTGSDALPVPGAVTWLCRGGRPAAGSTSLLDAVRDLALPDANATAYLAGEARTVQAIRNHLVTDRGWDRRNVRTKPFWTPGKRGME